MVVFIRYKDGTKQTLNRVSSWNYSKDINAYVFKAIAIVESPSWRERKKDQTIIIGRETIEFLSIRED